jgi:hypothetical protein
LAYSKGSASVGWKVNQPRSDSVYQVFHIYTSTIRIVLAPKDRLYNKHRIVLTIFILKLLPYKRSTRMSASWKIIQDDPAQPKVLQPYKPPDPVDPKRQIREDRFSKSGPPDTSSGMAGMPWVCLQVAQESV